VKITMKSPWVPFPYYLAGGIGGQPAYLMAPSMIKTKTSTNKPVGTGPFKFQEWIPNSHFTATAWEHYWRPGLPYLDQITFKPIPDGSTRADALQSGTIDIMVTDTPKNILTFRGHSQWAYIDSSTSTIGEPTVTCLLLNLAKPPFDDPTVRLAAAKAVTRTEYARVINYGVDRVADGLFVPGSPYYSPTKLPTHDPAGAKSLLDKVARRQGKQVSFTLHTTTSPSAVRAGTFLQTQFERVGFKVTTTTVEQNKLIDDAIFGDFQAQEWRQFGAVQPDLNYIFWSTTTYTKTGVSINMARNDDPRVQKALELGRTSPNRATQIKAYQEVNQLLAEDLPYLWATWSTWAIVAQPSVENFNNPTTPTGAKAYGLTDGSIWPTQIWIN
jgi:peptide/nickel transport system substrate-binding protein